MRINEVEIRHLAQGVIEVLREQGFVRFKVDEKTLVQRVTTLLIDNFKQEQELEEEAERLAEKHGRQITGMDHHKIIQGIKTRLAKERGFAL
jgi:hypothetical protein